MSDPFQDLAERLEQAMGEIGSVFQAMLDMPGGPDDEPQEPESEWLWPVLIDDTTTPITVTVVNKRYQGPWGTSALNRAQKEAQKAGVPSYGAVHGDTYEEAVVNAQRYV